MKTLIPVITVLMVIISFASADEKLKDIACRSVHLQYSAPEGTAFYNEVLVEQSADGTYFCTCGFNRGYFGIQQKGDGKKLVIFSVWDAASGDDPKVVPEEQRVKVLHQGEGVRVGRFGNEGTGGQSFFDYDWKSGQTYRFLVTARADGTERTAYSGYFFLPEKSEWKQLVSFSTPNGNKTLGGYYSFVEDFKRDRVSTKNVRSARFENGWVKSGKGEWVPLLKARFTADRNPVTNIDAGRSQRGFILSTGGMTENKTTPLDQELEGKTEGRERPDDLPVEATIR